MHVSKKVFTKLSVTSGGRRSTPERGSTFTLYWKLQKSVDQFYTWAWLHFYSLWELWKSIDQFYIFTLYWELWKSALI